MVKQTISTQNKGKQIMETNENKIANIGDGIIEAVKKTKNTSVKNLTVSILSENDKQTETIKNMCQVWKFIKSHYADDKNLSHKIEVYQGEKLLKDIHAEKKASGKVWMVDKMQIGKHTKATKPEIVK